MARTGEDTQTQASPTAGLRGGHVAGRVGLGRGGVLALAAALIGLVAAVVVGVGSGGDPGLPAGVVPSPGDDLAAVDVVRADDPGEVPEAEGTELVAPVHAVTTSCQIDRREFPAASSYQVVTDTVSSGDGPTVCGVEPLADGRLAATVGWGTDDLRMVVIDPRQPEDGPQPVPAALGDAQFRGFTGSGVSAVVGFVDDTSEALVARRQDGVGAGLLAVDVDTGEERELLAPGAVGDADSGIAAAHVRDGHLMVTTAGPTAIRRDLIGSMNHGGSEATRIWFGALDGELALVRQPWEDPSGDEFVPLDLHPPRIVDGPDGPLVASFERQTGDVWQLVLSIPDGASRVAAELGSRVEPVRSTADERPPRPARFSQSGTGVGFMVDDAAEDADPIPTVLLLDLDDGTWSRLPVNATMATFDRTEQ